MPNVITPSRIILNHSYEAGAEPDSEFLEPGEIALNATDNILFYLNEAGDLVKKSLDINANILTEADTRYGDKLLKDAVVNSNGDLILTFENNDTKNLGSVIGPVGKGIGFDGVVDYANQLPDTPPTILNKSGTTYLVRLGTASGNLFSPSGARIYVYDSTKASGQRWSDIGVVTGPVGPVGPTGATGPQGPAGLNGLISNPAGITGATAITNIVKISQSNFNSLLDLNQLDANTTYLIF